MMIPIKIECGCGQHYAFDIEPVGGRMPSAVACPACGVDGTDASNAALEQYLSARSPVAAAAAPRLHIAAPAHAEETRAPAQPAPRRRTTMLPGQVDQSQAVIEAKAKISWGDPPNEVIAYLRMQGFSAQEASSMIDEMYRERAATIRANGIRKIVIGSGLICVPIVSLLGFLALGYIPLKIFAVTVMVGLWGAWMAFKGTFMVLAPKMESGDVAEQ